MYFRCRDRKIESCDFFLHVKKTKIVPLSPVTTLGSAAAASPGATRFPRRSSFVPSNPESPHSLLLTSGAASPLNPPKQRSRATPPVLPRPSVHRSRDRDVYLVPRPTTAAKRGLDSGGNSFRTVEIARAGRAVATEASRYSRAASEPRSLPSLPASPLVFGRREASRALGPVDAATVNPRQASMLVDAVKEALLLDVQPADGPARRGEPSNFDRRAKHLAVVAWLLRVACASGSEPLHRELLRVAEVWSIFKSPCDQACFLLTCSRRLGSLVLRTGTGSTGRSDRDTIRFDGATQSSRESWRAAAHVCCGARRRKR